MIIRNSIGWCDETGNKVTGCDKVSPGCKNCYAQVGTRARVLRAQGIETWGPKGQRYPVKDFSTKVRRLNKLCVCDRCHTAYPVERLTSNFLTCKTLQATAIGQVCCEGTLRRIRVFADSNSDWLDERWPIKTLADLLKDIHDCPNLDFLLLTKRPENGEKQIRSAWNYYKGEASMSGFISDWLGGGAKRIPQNVWIGTSVEDQKRADERIPLLLSIPAKLRFLSAEPLLENVRLDVWIDRSKRFGLRPLDPVIDWVIGGLESGKDRRDPGVEPLIDLAHQCVAANVPFYCKQDCAFKPGQQGRIPYATWALKQFPRANHEPV